jgi:esterase/lipase superfamily enzyme
MGNRVLIAALERLALQNAKVGFNNVVMAAPDINIADFEVVTKALRASAKRTTVYSSAHDVALIVSKTFHKFARLGEAPPTRLSPFIDTIDASEIQHDLLGHSYFGDSATALHDMLLLLKEGKDPEQRKLETRELGAQKYWRVPPVEALQK